MARRDEYDDNAPETVVGASVKIEGDLVSEGNIRVEGQVVGKIKTSKNLYVGPGARIEANVEAANATFAGALSGDIKVTESLLVQETARISGNIVCQRLAINDGALFTGNCQMPEGEQQETEETEEE